MGFPSNESHGGVFLGQCHWRGLSILCSLGQLCIEKRAQGQSSSGTRPRDTRGARAWLWERGQGSAKLLDREGVVWMC